jgi:PIN domain nuclease of toxin-antitoxin system
MLHVAGYLQLNQPVERWIREALDRAKVRVIDLDCNLAVDAGLIPAAARPDPFDRYLVATARDYGLPLVTRDRRILEYAKRTGLVTVVDASL